MSTRRSTRATSKGASDLGGDTSSVTHSMLASTPAKRNARAPKSTTSTSKSKSKLPKVGTKGTTAYGTNNEVRPAQIHANEGKESHEDILEDILGTKLHNVTEEDEEEEASTSRVGSLVSSVRGRRTRQRNLDTPLSVEYNETFSLESDLNMQAKLDSSSVDDLALGELSSGFGARRTAPRRHVAMSPVPSVEEESEEEIRSDSRVDLIQDTEVIESLGPSVWEIFTESLSRTTQVAVDNIAGVFRRAKRFIATNPGIFWLCFVAVLLGGLFTGRGYEKYGQPLLHGSWLPTFSGPTELWEPALARSYQQELRNLKREIIQLKPHKQLDPTTVEKLQDILPDLVLCKKDKQNRLQIPDDFWRALQDKIRNDDTLFEKDTGGQESRAGLSKNEVQHIAQGVAENVVKKSDKIWDKFLDNNRERITQWQEAAVFAKNGKAYNSDVVERLELIGKIKENWEANEEAHRVLQKRVDYLSERALGTVYRRLNKVEHDLVTMDQLNTAVSQQIRRMVAATQLDTLSKANNKQISDRGLDKVNFFSKGTGARIIPYLTAPNFVFPSMRMNWFKRKTLEWTLGPVAKPMPPEVALEHWEEHGDCWCAPSKITDGPNEGFGPSIGVALGREITPDQVIVEHISPGASLEPGATPKEMELFAEILDPVAFDEAQHRSHQFFREHFDYPPFYNAPKNFVRLGMWTYDANMLQTAQSFPLQVDLSTIKDAYTNKIVVHARNNWGGNQVPYTCMYRIRVMGEVKKRKGEVESESDSGN